METKRNLLFIALTTCLVMFGANVNAACTADRCYGQIERVNFYNGMLYISTDGDESKLDCTAPGGVFVTIPDTDPNFNRLYAMILTSMSLEKNIGLRISRGSTACSLNYTYMDK